MPPLYLSYVFSHRFFFKRESAKSVILSSSFWPKLPSEIVNMKQKEGIL